jgi:hypothetical protein
VSLSHVQELAPCFFLFRCTYVIPLRCAASERTILGLVVLAGVKDVVLEANAKDEVEVTGTMDIPNMVSYLTTGSKLLAHDIRDGLKH